MNMKTSVVIPVLNAAGSLPALLEALAAQHPSPPDEIVLVDSLSTDDTRRIALAHTHVRVLPLARFSHGRARNLGAREATGEIVVLMTQDALPADRRWRPCWNRCPTPRWRRCVPGKCRGRMRRPRKNFFWPTISRPVRPCAVRGLRGGRRPLKTFFFPTSAPPCAARFSCSTHSTKRSS